jgi:hypothetical protein
VLLVRLLRGVLVMMPLLLGPERLRQLRERLAKQRPHRVCV